MAMPYTVMKTEPTQYAAMATNYKLSESEIARSCLVYKDGEGRIVDLSLEFLVFRQVIVGPDGCCCGDEQLAKKHDDIPETCDESESGDIPQHQEEAVHCGWAEALTR